jgi:serine protease Do
MKTLRTALVLFPLAALAANAQDQLKALSASIQALSQRVNGAVVQVFATGYTFGGDDDAGSATTAGLITKQRSSGSGVIITPDGYIVTNNHVVQNARRVRVQVESPSANKAKTEKGGDDTDGPPGLVRAKLFEATVVGTDREIDLAVLKITSPAPLPVLKFADSEQLKQGQIVLAFGNPLGLENSLSMGVVSSVGRQVKPDDPMTYIQTDAPINPGNSGGPLVNSSGEIVGINTFILTQSGGSEGIGFAIPSNVVDSVYKQILKDGHVHRGEIGVTAQSITPELAAGLSLKQDWGVILNDVDPDGPAATSGLQPGDIIVSLDGKPVADARQFQIALYRLSLDSIVTVGAIRDTDRFSAQVKVTEREDDPFRFLDLVRPEKNRVLRLGIIGVEITKDLAKVLPDTRKPYGIIVAARSGESDYSGQGGLKLGDVIYSVNNVPVATLDALRGAMDRLKITDPLVMQIERGGRLLYLTLSE